MFLNNTSRRHGKEVSAAILVLQALLSYRQYDSPICGGVGHGSALGRRCHIRSAYAILQRTAQVRDIIWQGR